MDFKTPENGERLRPYHRLLQDIVEKLQRETDISGVLLIGSVARGDVLPGSDLDLRILLAAGQKRSFLVETHNDIVVEYTYINKDDALDRLRANPMEVYAYLDGRILFDPDHHLAQLIKTAHEFFDTYQVSSKEKQKVAYWLKSGRVKLTAAIEAQDWLKVAYVCSTLSWPLIEALWTAKGLSTKVDDGEAMCGVHG